MERHTYSHSRNNVRFSTNGPRRVNKDTPAPDTNKVLNLRHRPLMDSSKSAAFSRWNIGRTPRVCVIGAGIAGLRCAEILIQKGFDVTILEGRNRIGGRVHQAQLHDHQVDMGANWIHGTDNNPILGLARETNTSATSINEEAAAVDETGHPMPYRDAINTSERVWSIIGEAFKCSNDGDTISSRKSLKDFFDESVEALDVSKAEKRNILLMSEMWGSYIGTPHSCQSLKYFWLEESVDGENLFVSGTYRRILERISETGMKQAHLRLSTIVTSIQTPTKSSGLDLPVQIGLLDSSEKLGFDAVILTLPLGCLKNETVQIEPPLPLKIKAAIQNVSYGNLEKVYVTFPVPFWDSGRLGRHPSFTHFLHPTYAGSQNLEAAIVELLSLSSFAVDSHPTLLFYIHGSFAKTVVESVDKLLYGSSAYLASLEERFKPYFSRLPNYDASNPECQPIDIRATSWSTDPLAGFGSYSNFQIPRDGVSEEDAPELDKDIEAIRRGCPDRRLWIAGEHTAPFVALGTVTGAYWSGENTAMEVAQSFGARTNVAFENDISDVQTVQVGKGIGPGLGGLSV